MSKFLRALVLFTVVAHLPFILGLHALALRQGWPAPWLIALAASTAGVGMFVGRARAGMPDRRRGAKTLRLVDIPYFVHWCACVFTVIPSVVGVLGWLVLDIVRGEAPALHGDYYLGAYALGVVVCGYGILARRRFFRVTEIEVPLTGLAPAFDGYRIAHLSDLHIGALTPKSWGDRWTQASNAEKPDLAVITGDMVTSGVEFHEDIAEVIAGLRAPDGVYVSMGNHDYFGEGEPLITLLRARGAHVLRNEGVVLERDAGKMYLAAIDDTWTRRADMARALAERPDGMTTVLLAHDPAVFPDAAQRDVSLMLSGHTHGGQIAMPFLGRWVSLSHLAHKFHIGLYRLAESTLYVHPGLGTTGPPMRLGVAPAVVILRLRAV